MMHRRISLAALLAMAFLLLGVASVHAESLDEAKAAGYVGEQQDGYVGARSSAPAKVREMVGAVNVRRRVKYAQIATRNGTPLEAVARLAGTKLIARTPSGEYVRNSNGQWQKKP